MIKGHRFLCLLLLSTQYVNSASAFSAPAFSGLSSSTRSHQTLLFSSETTTEAEAGPTTTKTIDPKDAVKLFGRLAEKYIMLDASAGMCCYSACSDCEFRLPDGGYKMADQSAARPKWIPNYDERSFGSGKEHTTQWSTQIFTNGPAVTKEEFVSAIMEMKYTPPLGGPYVGASSATLDSTEPAEILFDLLAGEKEKLTKHRMSTRIKEMADGEEGLTWAAFSKHITA